MAKHKQHQVPLVSDSGPSQPPLPGGWALAIFNAIEKFAPGFAHAHRIRISRGTRSNVNRGATIKQSTYNNEIERRMVEIVATLFPLTAATSPCIDKFVNEFFRLWTLSADGAPAWAKIHGFTPSQTATLSRALVRDLALRLFYLEGCERNLNGASLGEWELNLLSKRSFPRIYDEMIVTQMQRHRRTQIGMGLKLGVDSRQLRAFKSGDLAPSFELLRRLCPGGESPRLLAGIGFCDALLRRLHLSDTGLAQEILRAGESFFPLHQTLLETISRDVPQSSEDGAFPRTRCGLKGHLAQGENILLYPGFEELVRRKAMRTALWRCHLYSLRFARMFDLAQAYVQFSAEDDDHPLEEFLAAAERDSDGCPYRWMKILQEPNRLVAFPERAV